MRRLAVALGLVVAIALAPGVALAAWGSNAVGSAAARAQTMPGVAAPSASVSGSDVTLWWSASTFPSGDPVDGYVVRRYDASTGTPQTVLSACDGTVAATSCTELGVPDGSWVYTLATIKGPWTGLEGPPSAVVSVAAGGTGPTISALVVAKAQGETPGYLAQGGTYHVYADASAADGVSAVTADVGAITVGGSAVPLVAGSYTVGGVTYGYRSASLVAASPLTEGSLPFSVTAIDGLGVSATAGGAVTIDNTAPRATDVQTANASGGTLGRAESGDTVTLTFSEPIEKDSIPASWTGPSATVTVRLVNGAASDALEIWNAADTSQLPLGTILLGRTDYTSQTRRFTSSTMTMTMSDTTIRITLGNPSGGVRTAGGTGAMTWTPTSVPYDLAGNALLTAPAVEGGAADVEF